MYFPFPLLLWCTGGAKDQQSSRTFAYQDLKTVYTIVMFENSPKECKDPELSDIYLHGYVRISVSPGGGCYHVF